MKFWGEKGETSYPWKSLDTWLITENIRWGRFDANLDIKALVDKTNRSDLWIAAAKALGVAGHPTGRVARRREVLRRQDFRSGQPLRLSRLARHQARRLTSRKNRKDRAWPCRC
jgi:hypothetical protein